LEPHSEFASDSHVYKTCKSLSILMRRFNFWSP